MKSLEIGEPDHAPPRLDPSTIRKQAPRPTTSDSESIASTPRRATSRGAQLEPVDAARTREAIVSRYDILHVEIYASARKHGIGDDGILHAVDQALVAGEQEDGKVLSMGPDRAGNLLEVVSVARDDGTEIVIHAMKMRPAYEQFLRGKGDADG